MNYLNTSCIKKCNYSYKIHPDILNKEKNQIVKPIPAVFKWCSCHINKSNKNIPLDAKCKCN
jgi:hypothetical protein